MKFRTIRAPGFADDPLGNHDDSQAEKPSMTKAYRTDRMCDDDINPVDFYETVTDPEDAATDDDSDLAEMDDFSDDAFDWPDDDDEDVGTIDADPFA